MTAKTKSGFGAKLYALRIHRNQTQLAMAKEIKSMFPKIHLGQTNISMLEKRSDAPRQVVLDALSAYFDVPITYWYEKGEDFPNDAEMLIIQILQKLLNKNAYLRASAVTTHKFCVYCGELSFGLENLPEQHTPDCPVLVARIYISVFSQTEGE